MRQAFQHSDQSRNQDTDFDLDGPSADPDYGRGKSCYLSLKEPDNTRFPFAKEMKHTPSSLNMNLASNSLAGLWRRHTPRTYQILLLVSPAKVRVLTSIQWHKSQRCTLRPDGYAMMEFRVQCLSGIKSWLKRHAPCIQIIREVSP